MSQSLQNKEPYKRGHFLQQVLQLAFPIRGILRRRRKQSGRGRWFKAIANTRSARDYRDRIELAKRQIAERAGMNGKSAEEGG